MSSTFAYESGWEIRPSELEILADRAAVLPLERSALRPILRSWAALADGSFGAPFTHPAFILATARHLCRGDAMAIAAFDGDSLAGVLPLLREGRTLVSVASLHTPRFDYVGEPAALPRVWQALDRMRGWDVLRIDRVPNASPLLTTFVESAEASGARVVIMPHIRSPFFAIDGFEERLSSKFRGELRRAEAKLDGLRFVRTDRFDPDAFRAALEIETLAWKGSAGTAITCDEPTRRFYEIIARWAARRGELRLSFLTLGDRRIAMHFAIEHDRVYYLLKPGYDPELARHSPGQLMMRAAALDARSRGVLRCDLLGKDDAWKRKWTDDLREHSSLLVYKSTPLGRARYFQAQRARPLAGRVRRWFNDRVRR